MQQANSTTPTSVASTPVLSAQPRHHPGRVCNLLADVVHLTPTSIKTYLSAVWSLHIDRGWPDPLQAASLTQRVLSGVKRIHGMHSRLNRLPITGTVLDRLVRSLQTASWLPIINRHLLTAACTLAFHGFLRCSEFTTSLSRSSIRVL